MEKFVKSDELVKHVPFCIQQIYKMMDRGEFPRPLKLGKRRVAWREADVIAWQKGKRDWGVPAKEAA